MSSGIKGDYGDGTGVNEKPEPELYPKGGRGLEDVLASYQPTFEQATREGAAVTQATEDYYSALGSMPGIYETGAQQRGQVAKSAAAGVSGDVSRALAQTAGRNPFGAQQAALGAGRERANIMAQGALDQTALRQQAAEAKQTYAEEKAAELPAGVQAQEEIARLHTAIGDHLGAYGLDLTSMHLTTNRQSFGALYQFILNSILPAATTPQAQKEFGTLAAYYYYLSYGYNFKMAESLSGYKQTPKGIPQPSVSAEPA